MKKSLQCVYDLRVLPTTYDVLVFLITAEITRIRRGLDYLSILILKGDNEGFRYDNKGNTFEHNQLFLQNVIIPSFYLIPSVNSISWCNLYDFPKIQYDPNEIFPRGYTITNPEWIYPTIQGNDLVSAHLRGDKVGYFESPKYSIDWIDQYINNFFGIKKIITLTVREISKYDPNKKRTIIKKEWERFFEKILSKGYQPLVIRDTQNTFDNKNLFDGIPEFPSSSIHLPLRIALYEKSFLNFFTSNGPAGLGFWGKCNSCHLYTIEENNLVISSRYFANSYGMSEGGTFPMTTTNSKVLWNTQNSDKLIQIVEQIEVNGQITNRLNEYADANHLNCSVKASLENLMRNMASGHVLLEDAKTIQVLHQLFQSKKISINPIEFLKDNEQKYIYMNKMLPKNMVDKILKKYFKFEMKNKIA